MISSLRSRPNWRAAVVALQAVIAVLLTLSFADGAVAGPAAVPTSCDAYGGNNVTPPEKILVRMSGTTTVNPVDFKPYVKDVLPNEWLPNWQMAAYQAGAMAVKTYGWNFTINWRNDGLHYVPETGQCFDVWSDTLDQVFVAGSSTTTTAYAVEQTWNWVLHSGGVIYPTFYQAGCPGDVNGSPLECGVAVDGCGYFWLDRQADNNDSDDGKEMSQNGSQSCALAGYSWPRIVSTYYFPNATYPGEHIYGQWHATMSRGPAPYTPVSVSGYTWKVRALNDCGPPHMTFNYGSSGDMFVVGDWNGDGQHTQGVARPGGGTITWFLHNTLGGSGWSYTPFTYGSTGEGDIPVVGDWDGNGTWTPGVYRNGTWLLSNVNAHNDYPTVVSYGAGSDIPVPGKWKAISAGQPMTIGVVRLAASGYLQWWLRDSNTGGDPTIPVFEYGGYDARPLSGDYLYGGLSQFGVGVVTDAQSPSGCTTPNPNQTWLLHVCPCAGPPDMAYFYELNRP